MYLTTWKSSSKHRDEQPHNFLVDFSKDSLFGASGTGNNEENQVESDTENEESGSRRRKSRNRRQTTTIAAKSIFFSLPYPLHEFLDIDIDDIIDNIRNTLDKKKAFDSKLTNIRSRCKLTPKNIKLTDTADESLRLASMPKILLDLHFSQEADHDVTSDYNLFYTGGFLDAIKLKDQVYLIRSNVERKLWLTNVENSSESFDVDCSIESSIHNLKVYENLVLLREKSRVSIIKIQDKNKYNKVYIDNFQNPLLDAKLNIYQTIIIGTIQNNGMLIVKNWESNDILYKFRDDTKSCIYQFNFLSVEKLILMSDYILTIFNQGTKIKTLDPQVIPCNRLLNFQILNDVLYLISRHYVLKCSLKPPSKEFTHFSHTMEHPPIFLDMIQNKDDSYLILASHFNDYKILFTGNQLFSLPYRVSSIENTLREANLRFPEILLIDKIEKRLAYSTAGIKLLILNDKVYIFTSNSLGEIFKQEISETEFEKEIPAKTLAEFALKIPSKDPKLYVTNLANMTEAFFTAKSRRQYKKPPPSRRKSKHDLFINRFEKLYSKQAVSSTMGKHFLEAWTDSEESSGSETENIPVARDRSPEAFEKVTHWMEQQEQGKEKEKSEKSHHETTVEDDVPEEDTLDFLLSL